LEKYNQLNKNDREDSYAIAANKPEATKKEEKPIKKEAEKVVKVEAKKVVKVEAKKAEVP
jgi:hypothetical protein